MLAAYPNETALLSPFLVRSIPFHYFQQKLVFPNDNPLSPFRGATSVHGLKLSMDYAEIRTSRKTELLL